MSDFYLTHMTWSLPSLHFNKANPDWITDMPREVDLR
jgi:hypothetical protein